MLALAGSWAGYFLFTGLPQLTLHVFPATIALHAVAGGAIVVYLLYLAIARKLPGGTPLDLPVIALVLAYALATYTSRRAGARASNRRCSSARRSSRSTCCRGCRSLTRGALRRSLMLIGAALAFYALWVVGNDYADYLRHGAQRRGTEGQQYLPGDRAARPRRQRPSERAGDAADAGDAVLRARAYRVAAMWERASVASAVRQAAGRFLTCRAAAGRARRRRLLTLVGAG